MLTHLPIYFRTIYSENQLNFSNSCISFINIITPCNLIFMLSRFKYNTSQHYCDIYFDIYFDNFSLSINILIILATSS